MFCKKGVLKNFAKFSGKHLWQSLLFSIRYQKRNSDTGALLWIFAKFLRIPVFIEHLWWLLLSCFSSLFLTKVTISINVSGVIRKSGLNYSLIARSFLFFHMCWNELFSVKGSNLFIRSMHLWILFLGGFLRLLINCCNIKRNNFSFITAYFFTSTVLTFFASTYCADSGCENPFIYFNN